jgi:hypothetical protein
MSHFIKLTNEDGETSYVNMDRAAYFTGCSDGLTLIEFLDTSEGSPQRLLVKETLGDIHRLLQVPRI